MNQAAKSQNFEVAASYRNKLYAMQELQRRVMFGDKEFLDISKDKALADLAMMFDLKTVPARIEGYDISHQSGRDVVASMVVFTNGVSDRAEYRKFKVSEKNDDAGNIGDVIFRRLSERNLSSWGRPDLILIDGGKPQLAAAINARNQRGVKVPVISVAKREEEVIIPANDSHTKATKILELSSKSTGDMLVRHDGDFIVLNLHPNQRNAGSHSKNLRASQLITNDVSGSRYTDVVKLFQRIRDESHRFAVSYHTTLKRQKSIKSQLEDVDGVGAVTRRKLLRHFGYGKTNVVGM